MKNSIDLDYQMQFYPMNGKIARLLYIASKDSSISIECYDRAINLLLDSNYTEKYQQVLQKLNMELATKNLPTRDLNVEYLSLKTAENNQMQSRLETELKSYTSNFIRESIRIGHLELAEFYYNQGDLNSSLKFYVNSRDFCTTQSHVLESCLKVVELSMELGNYQNVATYLHKASQTLMASNSSGLSTNAGVMNNRTSLLSAMYNLENGNFKQASNDFKNLGFTSETLWAFVCSRDVAIYGGICMLASLSRQELKEAMENVEFKQYLELEPRMREICRQFHACQFSIAFKLLQDFQVILSNVG